jgi:hypothetical protein
VVSGGSWVVHVPGWFLYGDTCTLVGYICVLHQDICCKKSVCMCVRVYMHIRYRNGNGK